MQGSYGDTAALLSAQLLASAAGVDQLLLSADVGQLQIDGVCGADPVSLDDNHAVGTSDHAYASCSSLSLCASPFVLWC